MLIGFGVFAAARRKTRTVKHSQTGKPIRIDARFGPVFRPRDGAKEAGCAEAGEGRSRNMVFAGAIIIVFRVDAHR